MGQSPSTERRPSFKGRKLMKRTSSKGSKRSKTQTQPNWTKFAPEPSQPLAKLKLNIENEDTIQPKKSLQDIPEGGTIGDLYPRVVDQNLPLRKEKTPPPSPKLDPIAERAKHEKAMFDARKGGQWRREWAAGRVVDNFDKPHVKEPQKAKVQVAEVWVPPQATSTHDTVSDKLIDLFRQKLDTDLLNSLNGDKQLSPSEQQDILKKLRNAIDTALASVAPGLLSDWDFRALKKKPHVTKDAVSKYTAEVELLLRRHVHMTNECVRCCTNGKPCKGS